MSEIKIMSFISVHKYANTNNLDVQNVYRWIRERKFKDEDIKIEEVTQKRIRIKEDAKKA